MIYLLLTDIKYNLGLIRDAPPIMSKRCPKGRPQRAANWVEVEGEGRYIGRARK